MFNVVLKIKKLILLHSSTSASEDPFVTSSSPFSSANLRISPRPATMPRPSGRERPGFGPVLAAHSANDLEKEWNERVNIPLRKVVDFFRQSCISCFFGSRADIFNQHRTEHCPVSNNLMGYDAGLSGFRKKFDIPYGCCYGCTLSTRVSRLKI